MLLSTKPRKYSLHVPLSLATSNPFGSFVYGGTKTFILLNMTLLWFSCSVVSDSLCPHGLQHSGFPCSSPSWSLLRFIQSVMPSNHLILCQPLLFQSSILSSISVFSNELALCIWWPKISERQLQPQSFQCIFRVDFL